MNFYSMKELKDYADKLQSECNADLYNSYMEKVQRQIDNSVDRIQRGFWNEVKCKIKYGKTFDDSLSEVAFRHHTPHTANRFEYWKSI